MVVVASPLPSLCSRAASVKPEGEREREGEREEEEEEVKNVHVEEWDHMQV